MRNDKLTKTAEGKVVERHTVLLLFPPNRCFQDWYSLLARHVVYFIPGIPRPCTPASNPNIYRFRAVLRGLPYVS